MNSKYLQHIDLIKQYAKTMTHAEIARKLGNGAGRSALRIFCLKNNIVAQTRRYKKNTKKLNHSKDLIEQVQKLAKQGIHKITMAEMLNITYAQLNYVCKFYGISIIKQIKPSKHKRQKQYILLEKIEDIKLQLKQHNMINVAKMYNVATLTLYNFCRRHDIEIPKTIRESHRLAQEKRQMICTMIKRDMFIEDIMNKLEIKHAQYHAQIYRAAREGGMLESLKFHNKREFYKIKKQEIIGTQHKAKPVINNTLEYSVDNTRFVIRNTQASFR